MCGRYVQHEDIEALAALLGIMANDPALQELLAKPRYNIAPTQPILAVRQSADGETREGAVVHWGLVPFWAKDRKIGNRMINARSDTVFDKPAFRAAIKKRRCVIPASGFYEWKKVSAGARIVKQPFFIRRSDSSPMLFAGLYEIWKGEEPPLESGAILTTDANGLVAEVHDRMPVILDSSDVDEWLDPRADPGKLRALLRPCPDGWLDKRPVSTRVNSPANDDPDLVKESA